MQRVNLHCGFDLYKDETYDRLWTLYKHQRPKKIWVSTMCTLWCGWVDLNYYGRRDVVEKRRRGERQMFKKLVRFLKGALLESHCEGRPRCGALLGMASPMPRMEGAHH